MVTLQLQVGIPMAQYAPCATPLASNVIVPFLIVLLALRGCEIIPSSLKFTSDQGVVLLVNTSSKLITSFGCPFAKYKRPPAVSGISQSPYEQLGADEVIVRLSSSNVVNPVVFPLDSLPALSTAFTVNVYAVLVDKPVTQKNNVVTVPISPTPI